MTIKEALLRIGSLLTTAMKSKAPVNKGSLRDSIKYSVIEDDNGYQLERTMNKYGIYQDGGMSGTITKRNPNPKSFYDMGTFKERIISKQSGLPLPVRISIAQHGFQPQPFVGVSIESVMSSKGIDLLAEAGVDEVEVAIQEGVMKNVKVKA
jgi:hypothetical protein